MNALALVAHKGPVPADFAETVNPDPAMFGLPTEDGFVAGGSGMPNDPDGFAAKLREVL